VGGGLWLGRVGVVELESVGGRGEKGGTSGAGDMRVSFLVSGRCCVT